MFIINLKYLKICISNVHLPCFINFIWLETEKELTWIRVKRAAVVIVSMMILVQEIVYKYSKSDANKYIYSFTHPRAPPHTQNIYINACMHTYNNTYKSVGLKFLSVKRDRSIDLYRMFFKTNSTFLLDG